MKEPTHVLYIDDEQANLDSFRASFRREFKMTLALSAEEGLEILAREPGIQVIISDQRMPKMTGVEFFERVIKIYPEKIRILLTGFSDIQAVVEAINMGNVYRFIDKPWDFEAIRIAVINGRELYDTRKEIVLKNESLRKANEELDRFVYSVSHDLRSPLMSILGLVNLAKSKLHDPEAQEYLTMMEGQVGKLDEFIHQLIDYYKSKHDDRPPQIIDLPKLIDSIVADFDHHNERDRVKISCESNIDFEFKANEMSLRLILNNLISNAIKFHRPEEENQQVQIKAYNEGENVIIEISDNGIGIEMGSQDRIFEMFYRGTSRSFGSGLGLYIVRETARYLGGDVKLESELGQGSTFRVSIPSKH